MSIEIVRKNFFDQTMLWAQAWALIILIFFISDAIQTLQVCQMSLEFLLYLRIVAQPVIYITSA